jgi:FAD/FMN-containing dehydrogenase
MSPGTDPVRALREAIEGRVIGPKDEDYDDARAVFYGGMDPHPAAVARVAHAADVARVIALARERDIELSVRSGGHSITGQSVSDGGIVLDLGPMRSIEIDPQGRTAWAETGSTTFGFTAAAAKDGLGIGFGDTGSVGIGGLTLGGGVGYLVRRYGLTVDDLLAAEIATADGELLFVDEDSHPDLFWAIRGGGGNFGVATRFRFRLHELQSVVGGMLLLPADAETVHAFVAESEAAPEELSTIVNVMPAPPMPFVPEERHGELVIMALMCFAGDADAGAKALAPFRSLAEPIADMVRPIPYPEIYPPEDPSYHPVALSHTMFTDTIDRRAAETVMERLGNGTAPMRVAQLRVLGGAMSRVPNDATAFAHRDRGLMVNVAALIESPEDREAHEPWVRGLAAELQRGEPGAYVNFLGDDGEERIREAYPGPTWDRLRQIKGRYDPENLFRLNQNIPPAEAGS